MLGKRNLVCNRQYDCPDTCKAKANCVGVTGNDQDPPNRSRICSTKVAPQDVLLKEYSVCQGQPRQQQQRGSPQCFVRIAVIDKRVLRLYRTVHNIQVVTIIFSSSVFSSDSSRRRRYGSTNTSEVGEIQWTPRFWAWWGGEVFRRA